LELAALPAIDQVASLVQQWMNFLELLVYKKELQHSITLTNEIYHSDNLLELYPHLNFN
jgi:hypothetical protein